MKGARASTEQNHWRRGLTTLLRKHFAISLQKVLINFMNFIFHAIAREKQVV